MMKGDDKQRANISLITLLFITVQIKGRETFSQSISSCISCLRDCKAFLFLYLYWKYCKNKHAIAMTGGSHSFRKTSTEIHEISFLWMDWFLTELINFSLSSLLSVEEATHNGKHLKCLTMKILPHESGDHSVSTKPFSFGASVSALPQFGLLFL